MARPIKYQPSELTQQLIDYCKESDDPTIEDFCLQDGSPHKDSLYRIAKEYKPLHDAIKEVHDKQQRRTVRLVESGQMNPVWAIFKLKQPCYGWTDKQQVESINLNIDADLSENEADRILKSAGLRIEADHIEQIETIEDDE